MCFRPRIKLDKNVLKKYDAWMKEKYAKRKDKDNIMPVGITDAEFRQWATQLILGEGWYIADPLGHNQCNEVILEEIIFKFEGDRKRDS